MRRAVRVRARPAARPRCWSPAPAAPTRWRWPRPSRSRRRGPGGRPGWSPSTTACSRARPSSAARVAPLGYELGLRPGRGRAGRRSGTAGGPEAAARTARYPRSTRPPAALDAHGAARAHPRRPGRDGAARARPRLGPALDRRHAARATGGTCGRCSGCAGRRPRRPAPPSACRCGTTRTTPTRASSGCGCAREVLPLLEDVLQGGVAEALARTADLLRDDLDALDQWPTGVRHPPVWCAALSGATSRHAADSADSTMRSRLPGAGRAAARDPHAGAARVGGGAAALAASPPSHLAALDALVTGWHGQGAVELPGRRPASAGASGTLVATCHPSRRQEKLMSPSSTPTSRRRGRPRRPDPGQDRRAGQARSTPTTPTANRCWSACSRAR